MAVPVSSDDSGVTVAVCEPSLELISVLREAAKQPVHLVVAPRSDVQRAIDTTYRTLGQIKQYVEAFEATEGPRRPQEVAAGTVQADDAPVVQVVNLHPDPGTARPVRRTSTSSRKETDCRSATASTARSSSPSELPSSMAPAIASRLKILAGMNIVERRRPQDGQFTMELDGREIDIRVSTVATIWGECCTMRLLDKGKSLLHMADLGMPDDTHQTIGQAYPLPVRDGAVRRTNRERQDDHPSTRRWPRSTKPQRNIMTIEDPVEYVFPSINQIQTHEQAGITFATGLRSHPPPGPRRHPGRRDP